MKIHKFTVGRGLKNQLVQILEFRTKLSDITSGSNHCRYSECYIIPGLLKKLQSGTAL